jgi:putative transposase
MNCAIKNIIFSTRNTLILRYISCMLRTFKYRIYLNNIQREALNSHLNFCRFLYNNALEERIKYYKSTGKSRSYFDQAALLSEIKQIFTTETIGIYSQTLQSTLKQVDSAYKNFFCRIKSKSSKAGFPRFKNSDRFKSICFPQVDSALKSGCVKLLSDRKIRIYGIPGEVSINLHRPFLGRCKTVRIIKDGELYFITISCDSILSEALPKTNKSLAIDLGISTFITGDDGTTFHHPTPQKLLKNKLASLQRRLELKKRGSNNRNSLKKTIAKTYRKVVNIREDFQHKTANKLIKDNDEIILEDLNVKGMMEAEGFNVKKGNIVEAGWSNFVAKLVYKAESAGRKLIFVNPKNTSKMCSSCKNIKLNLTLKDRIYKCDACGIEIDRDLNASRNIRRLGTSLAIK